LLRSGPVGRVNFRIEANAVNQKLMEKVVNAIWDDFVAVTEGYSGPKLAASYNSSKTRVPKAWQKKRMGTIVVRPGAINTRMGKAAIFHECVHALKDLCNYKMNMQKDEAFAYLADAVYMAHENIKVTNTGKVGNLYTAANAIIKSKKMLEKPGTVLQWSDCEALIAAVKAIDVYSGH